MSADSIRFIMVVTSFWIDLTSIVMLYDARSFFSWEPIVLICRGIELGDICIVPIVGDPRVGLIGNHGH